MASPYQCSSRDDPADCTICGSPLSGDNNNGICFRCSRQANDMHQLNDSTVGFGRTDWDWDAYTHGQRATRRADHDPAAYPNPYQYHSLSWYSFNAGWNSVYPDDDGKEQEK